MRKHHVARRAALAGVATWVAACAAPGAPTAPNETAPPDAEVAATRVDPAVTAAIRANGKAQALVVLDAAEATRDLILRAAATPTDISAQRALAFGRAKQDVFATAPGIALDRDFATLPIAFVTISGEDDLARIATAPHVQRIAADEIESIDLAQSLPLIGQPVAAAEGKDGTGTAVAILDTGADYRVADLGACTAVGTPAGCRVVYAHDFAPDDGALDAAEKHGTNVASIVARVAPGTQIIALDVFTGSSGYDSVITSAIDWVIANASTYHIVAMNLSLGGGLYTAACPSTTLAVAIDEARRAGVLAAIATGNNGSSTSISSPACSPAAVAVGAVYDTNLGGLGYSACSDPTTAADQVTCFSNSTPFMTVLAPGALITAGGVTMAGTSQATPHVAGALAVLRGAFPTETLDETVQRLTDSGKPITDPRNGVTKPRIDLGAAAAGCVFRATPSAAALTGQDGGTTLALATSSSCGWTATSDQSWLTVTSAASGTGPASIAIHATANPGAARTANVRLAGDAAAITVAITQGVDSAPPTGSVVIDNGDAYTRTTTAALTIAGADLSGVASMCVTNSTTCTTFIPFATSKTWTLAGTQGVNTVRVLLRDARGNTTPIASAFTDTIVFDTVAPTSGAVTATPRDGAVDLTWLAGTDATSGVDHYVVVGVAGATAPTNCTATPALYTGANLAFTDAGRTNGTTYSYRVCAVDAAGNIAAGTTASTSPRPESDPPTGTVAINNGAAYTKTASVTLTVSASDASGVSQMCFANVATACTAWVAYAPTAAFALTATQGERPVYAWFKDRWGNASATPAHASIVLDTVVPVAGAGTFTATFGDGTNTLAWPASTDVTSGVDHYVVVVTSSTTTATPTPPATCATGTLVYSGTATGYVHTGLVNGTAYAYRACAVDRAGNTSGGLTATASPRPEADPPTGAITIAGGATYTKTASVTLGVTATDASGVAQMCFANAATPACTAWVAYATSASFALTTTQGTRTVYAWFKDRWGNVSTTPATASIVLDTVVPVSAAGALAATYGDGKVTLAWPAATDATSGLDHYVVVYTASATATAAAPTSCATGTIAYSGADTTTVHAGLTNGTSYAYRACAVDRAGNVAVGTTAVTTPRPESDPPTGTIAINGGATYTNSTAVTVTLAATDASAVAQVCLSSTTTCTAWSAYATTKAFTLPATQGPRIVYAWFKDVWGNASPAVAAQASIVLDSVAPTTTSTALSRINGSRQISLAWTASTETGSGLAGYKLVVLPGTTLPAAGCTNGTTIYSGADLAYVHTGLTANATYAYRVCAVDRAGNTSSGAAVTGTAAP